MEIALIEDRELADMLSSKIRNSYFLHGANHNHNHWVNGIVLDGKWKNTDGADLVVWDSDMNRMWADSEPNALQPNGNCVELGYSGGFVDHPCWIGRKFICQRGA